MSAFNTQKDNSQLSGRLGMLLASDSTSSLTMSVLGGPIIPSEAAILGSAPEIPIKQEKEDSKTDSLDSRNPEIVPTMRGSAPIAQQTEGPLARNGDYLFPRIEHIPDCEIPKNVPKIRGIPINRIMAFIKDVYDQLKKYVDSHWFEVICCGSAAYYSSCVRKAYYFADRILTEGDEALEEPEFMDFFYHYLNIATLKFMESDQFSDRIKVRFINTALNRHINPYRRFLGFEGDEILYYPAGIFTPNQNKNHASPLYKHCPVSAKPAAAAAADDEDVLESPFVTKPEDAAMYKDNCNRTIETVTAGLKRIREEEAKEAPEEDSEDSEEDVVFEPSQKSQMHPSGSIVQINADEDEEIDPDVVETQPPASYKPPAKKAAQEKNPDETAATAAKVTDELLDELARSLAQISATIARLNHRA